MKSRSNWTGRIVAFIFIAGLAAVTVLFRSVIFAILGWLFVAALATLALLVLIAPDKEDPNDVYAHWDDTIDRILSED